MINQKVSKIIKASIAVAVLVFLSLPALAQSPTGELRLTTSPLPINLKTTPGNSISTQVKIKNDGNQAEDLQVVLMKFKADPVTGAANLVEREPTDSYFDWVTFSDPTFTVNQGEWKTVTANFNVPETAAFDYYYAITFFRSGEQTNEGAQKTVLKGGTATLVLLTVDVPGAKKQMELSSFTVNKTIFEFLPATFDVKMRNTGNVHIIPRGNIFISRSGSEKDLDNININQTQGAVLPDSPRTFETQWAEGFPFYTDKEENGNKVKDAQGKIVQELKWNWSEASKLRFGKYTAKLVMVYDDGQRDIPLEGEVSFWVVPWRLVGGALLIAIFVLIGLKSTLQNWYRKIKNIFSKRKNQEVIK
jgi:hypothetical protein